MAEISLWHIGHEATGIGGGVGLTLGALLNK